tara:strand:- start:1592 stop:2773 length:1182 start_codon:yes stop_codon:yes gene_type:complete
MSNKIFIVGAGYVGFATGVALAAKYEVVFIENDLHKLNKINSGLSPIEELDLMKALKNNQERIKAESDLEAVDDGSTVFVAVPTNYDEQQAHFDTKILDEVIEVLVTKKPNCCIVIKSTIPLGYTLSLRERLQSSNIYFSPEFLREGRSFKDVTNPDRIIVSPNSKDAPHIMDILSSVASINRENCLCTDSSTAEAVKLFSNTYLAMRVAYLNEVDTFCKIKDLNAGDLLRGICLDQRIGMFYNNPSFGFGGYCLPKDTKQTRAEAANLPMTLPDSIVKSNELRTKFLAADIGKNYAGKRIGIYGLSMKKGSDNVRNSSSTALLMELVENGHSLTVYEPMLDQDSFLGQDQVRWVNDIQEFISKTDLAIVNRPDDVILNSGLEIYTRNIFNEN